MLLLCNIVEVVTKDNEKQTNNTDNDDLNYKII